MVPMHIWAAVMVVLGLHLCATEAIKEKRNCGASGGLDVGQSYTFYSRHYPSPYPGGLNCRWTVITPENSIVNLYCPVFDIRRTYSYSWCIDTFEYSPSGDLGSGDYNEYCGRGYLNLNTTTNSFDVYFSSSWSNYNPHHNSRIFYCTITVIGDTVSTTPEITSREPSTSTPGYSTSTPEPSTPTPEPSTSTPNNPESSSTTTAPSTIPGNPEPCECGENNLKERIVGGSESEVHEWPWQVALRFQSSRQQFCGGSLISPDWVLTAAHCVVDFEVSQIFVSIGEHDLDTGSDTSHTVHRTISQKIAHSAYDDNSVINDIALIQLSNPVEYSHGISPVCLPTNLRTELFDGEDATVTGWGTTSYQGSISNILLEVTLPVISNSKCASLNGFSIRDDQVCTYEEGKDSCQGDSGGPLVWQNNDGHYHQIGIVSYGIGCADKDAPGVYTRVTSYIDWIQTNSNTNFCSPE